MRILSILALLLICKGGFGQSVPVLHKSKLKNNLAIQSIVSDNHVAIRLSYLF